MAMTLFKRLRYALLGCALCFHLLAGSPFASRNVVSLYLQEPTLAHKDRFMNVAKKDNASWRALAKQIQQTVLNDLPDKDYEALFLIFEGLKLQGYPRVRFSHVVKWRTRYTYANDLLFDRHAMNLPLKNVNEYVMADGFAPIGLDGQSVMVCKVLAGSERYWIEFSQSKANLMFRDLGLPNSKKGVCIDPLSPSIYWKKRYALLK